MTFWLTDTSEISIHAGKFSNAITMPKYNEQDYTTARSMLAVKRMLKEQDSEQPPEHLELLAQTIWRFVDGIDKEDIICAVEKDENEKPTNVYFAQVTNHVQYDDRLGKHVLPVRWFEESASMLRMKPYKHYLANADAWPSVIDDNKFRQALASHLPLPGSRFSKWTWIVILLVAAKILMTLLTEQSGGL